MSFTVEQIAERDLKSQDRRRLAAEPDLAARFAELTQKAIDDGPGPIGGCGNNPFWMCLSDHSELSGRKLFEHAAYTVRLDRLRTSDQVAA